MTLEMQQATVPNNVTNINNKNQRPKVGQKKGQLTLPEVKPTKTEPPVVKDEKPTETVVVEGENRKVPDQLLLKILSTRRRHTSDGDVKFRLWLFAYIKALGLDPKIVVEGNILVEVDPKSTVLFSCHMDTVHSMNESNDRKPQELMYDPVFGHLFLADQKDSSCLGGDDGVGVYIMLRMLEAKVKGKYIFHTGEEVGGVGSSSFVKNSAAYLEDIEQVVAFDRAVYDDANPEVILSQRGGRCASDEYGNELAKRLNLTKFDKPYVISHKGVFTDSANYSRVVPECVNLGCFYVNQHTPREVVDVFGVERLAEAACAIDWSTLPIKRQLQAPQPQSYNGYNGQPGSWRDVDDYDVPGFGKHKSDKKQQQKPLVLPTAWESIFEEFDSFGPDDWEGYVDNDPISASRVMALLHAKMRGLEHAQTLLAKFIGG